MCSKVTLARKEGLIVTTINGMIMNKRLWTSLALTLAVSTPNFVYASIDVDIDNDGLIEIATLEQLDLMRNDLAGTSLDGDSTGCPATGCHGYELVADLDFDTNGNGMADIGDTFWNNGLGWEPVGPNETHSRAFKNISGAVTADFNGNGFVISNMYIDRQTRAWLGLFSNMSNNNISNIVFANAGVVGGDAAGILSGALNNTDVSNVRISSSSVSGIDDVGLLTGHFYGSGNTIENINVEGQVSGSSSYAGGVIGWIQTDNYLYNSRVPVFLSNIISDVDVSTKYNSGCIAGMVRSAIGTNLTSLCEQVAGRNPGGVFSVLVYGELDNVYVNSNISGAGYVGGIVGYLENSLINNAYTSEEMQILGSGPAGLIGSMRDSSLSNSVSRAFVSGSSFASGAVTSVDGDNAITNIYSASSLHVTSNGSENKAGLIGVIGNSAAVSVTNSYWDIDTTGADVSADGLGEGKSSAVLKCPTLVGDVACDTSVYENWDGSIWDFATSSDYPVLR